MALFELRAKRIRAGLSPEQLGDQLGLHGRTIRNIEAGKPPSLNTAHTLAAWVGKDVLDMWPELAELPEPKESAA